ncbi:hypothetical protein PF010_g21103 [Phytophthora fragariae]|uniref:Uncharacterized protein n=1 Tax=Phytophthora fragariae TaxID=53985 RepID=A0A6A3QZD4_9STRA|nr:hypothetical protein PF003_g39862 [Phytophthora fragariae]KAE9083720.1 hypothetical protein PF010_g21103 [Phytophthora fragariae]KAE9086706.1 hypothetical protein PF006_g25969 [Phytophthora fragariae]
MPVPGCRSPQVRKEPPETLSQTDLKNGDEKGLASCQTMQGVG